MCPRLVEFREESRKRAPAWHNAPVPSFGPETGRLLIVGLAPGLQGANRTGRPFTGDWAGDLLYETLDRYGFSAGIYDERPDDGLMLRDCRVTNAVRCVPPANKPLPLEIGACNRFLAETIATMPSLAAIVALGRVAHDAVLKSQSRRLAAFPFGHGREHDMSSDYAALRLFDSYHCSRYNTNTGVLTTEMFHGVFARVRAFLEEGPVSSI